MWSSSYGSLVLLLPMQSVPITTNVVSSNPFQTRCTWYNICHFQQYFSYIVAVCFIGGGNWSTRRKPPTCRKTLTNFYHIMLYRVHLAMNGVRTHNFNSDRHWLHSSWKSNYHMITTTPWPHGKIELYHMFC